MDNIQKLELQAEALDLILNSFERKLNPSNLESHTIKNDLELMILLKV